MHRHNGNHSPTDLPCPRTLCYFNVYFCQLLSMHVDSGRKPRKSVARQLFILAFGCRCHACSAQRPPAEAYATVAAQALQACHNKDLTFPGRRI
eukprot:328943-Amphidinium_carterae.1